MRLMKPAPVMQEFARLRYPESLALGVGSSSLSVYYRLCDSAYVHSWRDLADRLPGWSNRYPRAHQRSLLHASRSRRAGLGRTILAGWAAARAHSAAKLALRRGRAAAVREQRAPHGL
jgi:hypothetical protein